MKRLFTLMLTLLFAAQLYAQNIVATGTVRDDEGTPLAGVSITEKGVTNSTLTDADGNFRLSLSAGRVLVISMSGYVKQEVRVDSSGDIDDIVLHKPFKRVRFGLTGGIDYNYYEYTYRGNTNVKLDFDDSSVGYNGGIYVDFNLSRTFAFEVGAQVYMRSYDFTSSGIHIACKWRMGKKKGLFITLGPGFEMLLKKPESDLFHVDAQTVNFSMGYEFESGIGFKVTYKQWMDYMFHISYEELLGYGISGGVAFTYRF